MEMTLESVLGKNTGICIKTYNREVIHQDEACQKICGRKPSTPCQDGCMAMVAISESCPALDEGVQLFQSKQIRGEYYDIIVINNGEQITTLLYPLSSKHEREMEFLKSQGLSKRELEIMSLIVRGATNSEVSKRLCISRSTLKTHLNNIYKKLPEKSRIDFKRRGSAENWTKL